MEKKRKRAPLLTTLLLAILLMVIPSSALSASKGMVTIPLTSPLYDYIEDLYVLEGLSAPQGAKPWTIHDFKQQIDRVTPTSAASQNLYDNIVEELETGTDDVAAEWNISLLPSVAAHTDNTNFDESDKWASQVLNDRLLRADFGLSVYDYFAGRIGISLGYRNAANSSYEGDRLIGSSNESRFHSTFSTNIPFVFSDGSIDADVSDSSFFAVGNEYISMTIGRGPLEMGNGLMGNMILGDTLPYHDYLSIAASNNSWFDYTMLASFFTHPMNYYQGFEHEIHGLQMLLVHRFEFRMFSDKLRLSVNESVMYQSEDNTIDFRVFNPLLIMHGYYIPANANSLLSIELEFAPIRSFQLYLSLGVDDLAMPGEPEVPEENSTLNMWGISGGFRASLPFHEGYFSFEGEVVYLSPFMYHKDSYGSAPYSLDFTGSIRLSNGDYLRRYLSFPFGSDSLAGMVKAGYQVPYSWALNTHFFAMLHGVTGVNSIAQKYDGTISEVPGWLATINPFDPDENGAISLTLNLGMDAEWYIIRNLKLETSLNYIHVFNFDNQPENNQSDLQWTFSLVYTLF